jgi:hypothetical protein
LSTTTQWPRDVPLTTFASEAFNSKQPSDKDVFVLRGSTGAWLSTSNFKQELGSFLATTSILVVIGRTDFLELPLQQDIKAICRRVGIDPTPLLDDITSNFDPTDRYIFHATGGLYTNASAVLSVLFNPTISDLQNALKEAIGRVYSNSFELYYCGHGQPDGSLCFFDGDVSGSEFLELLNDSTVGHYPQSRFVIDACNAVPFYVDFSGKPESTVYSELKSHGIDRPHCPDPDRGDVAQLMCSKFPKPGSGRPNWSLGTEWNGNIIAVYPLAFGDLWEKGGLPRLFEMDFPTSPDPLTQISNRRSLGWQTLASALRNTPSHAPLAAENHTSPTITVFRASKGDSTLFQWHDVSILIDGGLQAQPCFWSYVESRQIKLKLVALTHGDEDHINGLLYFVARKAAEVDDAITKSKSTIEKLVLFTTSPTAQTYPNLLLKNPTNNATVVAAPVAATNNRGFIDVLHLTNLAKLANIEIDSTLEEISFPTNEGGNVLVTFLAPNPAQQQSLTTQLRSAEANRTHKDSKIINATGLVILLTCTTASGAEPRLSLVFFFSSFLTFAFPILIQGQISLHWRCRG